MAGDQQRQPSEEEVGPARWQQRQQETGHSHKTSASVNIGTTWAGVVVPRTVACRTIPAIAEPFHVALDRLCVAQAAHDDQRV